MALNRLHTTLNRFLLTCMTILLFIFLAPIVIHAFGLSKITIKVVDEKNEPVEGAEVGVGFGENSQKKEKVVKGFTKSDGRFSASEACNSFIGFNVKKSGHYMSIGQYSFTKKGFLKWEPWNPEVTIILRKIENPVPMYARDSKFSEIEIPVIGKDVGFDLIAYDWVPPYGSGVHSDIIFQLKRKFVASNDQDSKLSIKFTNKYDGIQLLNDNFKDSELSLPRHAFVTGYKDKYELYIKSSHGKYSTDIETNIRKTDNYFIRIRSEEKKGIFTKGIYGKIAGSLDFSTVDSKTAKIIMKYYINPDHTSNLEFDPKRNLFGNLTDREQVKIK